MQRGKKQSHARRLSVGLFSIQAPWGSELLTHWQGQETPPQSAGNGNLLWAQHTWQFCSMPPSPLQQMDCGPPRPHKIPPVGRRLWRPIWVASHFARSFGNGNGPLHACNLLVMARHCRDTLFFCNCFQYTNISRCSITRMEQSASCCQRHADCAVFPSAFEVEMRLHWEFPWVPWVPWNSHGSGNR